jgi:multimeric flavodoxin WrbA
LKTLIINGSPRKNGDTVTLINEMVKSLEGEVNVVNTYYENISPCVDCRHCWVNSGCAIRDGMQDVYTKLNEVDNVILASPLYFSELSGSLLNFASRFQYFYASRVIRKDEKFRMKAKNGALILVGGGDTSDLSKALGTAKTLFKHIGVTSIGNVLSLHTDSICGTKGIRAKDDVEAIKNANEIAYKLNQICTVK